MLFLPLQSDVALATTSQRANAADARLIRDVHATPPDFAAVASTLRRNCFKGTASPARAMQRLWAHAKRYAGPLVLSLHDDLKRSPNSVDWCMTGRGSGKTLLRARKAPESALVRHRCACLTRCVALGHCVGSRERACRRGGNQRRLAGWREVPFFHFVPWQSALV